MRILKTSAALSAALLLSLAGASPSFAKAHNNGFGEMGGAGFGTSHGVIGGLQSNPTPGDKSNNYGQSDASNVEDGGRSGNSVRDAAQAPGNPSDSR